MANYIAGNQAEWYRNCGFHFEQKTEQHVQLKFGDRLLAEIWPAVFKYRRMWPAPQAGPCPETTNLPAKIQSIALQFLESRPPTLQMQLQAEKALFEVRRKAGKMSPRRRTIPEVDTEPLATTPAQLLPATKPEPVAAKTSDKELFPRPGLRSRFSSADGELDGQELRLFITTSNHVESLRLSAAGTVAFLQRMQSLKYRLNNEDPQNLVEPATTG